MRTLIVPSSLLALALALGPACGNKTDDTAPPEGDADTDGDADADTDADSDVFPECDTATDPDDPPTLCAAASAVMVGDADQDRLGTRVTGRGDLDGNGHDDVLALAQGYGTYGNSYGAMYVFGSPIPVEMTASEATASFVYSTEMGRVESAVILGDTNGDGFDDFVVGSQTRPNMGVYFGPVTGAMGFDEFDALVNWSEAYPGSTLPYTKVAAAGDVDGNGTADTILDGREKVFVMTTPLEGSVDADSQAWALLEPPFPSVEDPCIESHPNHNPIIYQRDGQAAAIGDLDGDGFSELIVTNGYWNEQWWTRDPSEPCEGYKGRAWVVQGPVSGTIDLASAAIALDGDEWEGAILGDADAIGDADGDGLDDFIVEGGERATDFVVFGPLTTGGLIGGLLNVARITGSEFSSFDLSGAGDVDGDGLGDLVMGIHTDDYWDHGAAILLAPFSGTRLIDDAEHLYRGEGENSWAGSSVSSAGDVDADGLMDVLIGADNTMVEGEYRGKVYLLYGADL